MRASPLGIRLFTRPASVVAPSGTTWAANVDWNLTNGNLTAERTGTSAFWGKIKTTGVKTNGTIIYTVVTIGAASSDQIGLVTSGNSSINGLGSDTDGSSIAYQQNGDIVFGGGIIFNNATDGIATYTTGDAVKIVKSGVNVSFYKNNVLQKTVDTSSATYGVGSIMAGDCYAAASSFNATGLKLTIDASSW